VAFPGPSDITGEDQLEDSADDLYENAPCGYLSTRPDGLIVRVNATFLAWTGHRREDLVGTTRFQELLAPGGRIYHETHYAPLLQMQGAVREIALELVRADGTRLPVLINATLRRSGDGTPRLVRTTVFDARDRKRYERELLAARDRERTARERVERLQRITAALAAPLDVREVARATVAELIASTGADRAALYLAPEEGDPELLYRHGPEPVPEPPRAAPAFADGPTATVDLPLRYGGRAVGVLALGFPAEREVGDDERAFLVACAGQCAQALERAALYAHEHDVAQTLQRSLMEANPPRDERVEIATHYAAGVRTLEVGGDWFDAFALGEDRVGMVVGDVVGRGLVAATAMGQLRNAARALALTDLGPARVLDALDRFVVQIPAARHATLAYAELELATGRLHYACAGHMPPLLAQTGEPPAFLWEGRSPPLGVRLAPAPWSRSEAETTLRPGARLLLYTDGLVERRTGSIDDGLARLAEAFARRPDATAARLVAEVPGVLVERPADDDVCLLALTFHGGRPARTAGTAAHASA
jgi:PAS domain S-box-containing protein